MFPGPCILRLGLLSLVGSQQVTEIGTSRALSLEISHRVLVDKVDNGHDSLQAWQQDDSEL